MSVFSKAEKIWLPEGERGILQIKIPFRARDALLKIACESDYAVYLDGAFLYAGNYKAPYGKMAFDVLPVGGTGGEERCLLILAAHFGRGCSTYRPGRPALIYELSDGEEAIAYSRAGQRAEICPWASIADYSVTGQLGPGFCYDLTKKTGRSAALVASDNADALIPRPVELCVYSDAPRKVTAQGKFLLTEGKTPAEKIFNAWFRPRELQALAGIHEWGISLPREISLPAGSYLLIDLEAERTGNIFFDIYSPDEQEILIGYGEHLDDLRPRTYVNGRHFAFSYRLKRGNNPFVQPFGRMGGRYLVLLAEKACRIRDAGIKEYLNRAQPLPFRLSDAFAQKIYDTAVRTNSLCMHVHYEDCPWREQAFYGMDARNQMLYGYYIFGETEFPKHALELFFSTQREDGLFDLCAPSEIGTTIPSFCLFAVMAAAEYYHFSRDGEFILKWRSVIVKCLDAFLSRREKNGLLTRFRERRYWNFYEWSDGLDGGDIFSPQDHLPVFDLPLNALLAVALEKTGRVFAECGIDNEYRSVCAEIVSAAEALFYDEDERAFAAFCYEGERSGYCELPQVLMLYLKSRRSPALAEMIAERRYPSVTVAFLGIKYDALFEYDENYADFVFSDIERIFGKMLLSGATSFYETEKGADDFEGAGSLCHAWASVPAYAYRKYLTGVDYEKNTDGAKRAPGRLKALSGAYVFDGQKREF